MPGNFQIEIKSKIREVGCNKRKFAWISNARKIKNKIKF